MLHLKARQRALAGWSVLLLAVVAGSGCRRDVRQSEDVDPDDSSTHQQGQVSGRLLSTAAEDRYPVEVGQRYIQPSGSVGNRDPEYPAQRLAERLPPVWIRVRVIVDERGQVSRVMALDPASSQEHADFFQSVQQSLLSWTYTPLIKLAPGARTTRITDSSGNDTEYQGSALALPFHLDYAFRFAQIDGQGTVTRD